MLVLLMGLCKLCFAYLTPFLLFVLELMILQDKKFDWPDYHFMDRDQKYDRVIQQCGYFAQKLREMPNASAEEINYLVK